MIISLFETKAIFKRNEENNGFWINGSHFIGKTKRTTTKNNNKKKTYRFIEDNNVENPSKVTSKKKSTTQKGIREKRLIFLLFKNTSIKAYCPANSYTV